MKHYPEEFWEQGSHGHAHRLLADAALPAGVVLDLGCATGPLAEPVKALGHDYVGADIDEAAIAELAGRGFEAHVIDLMAAEDDQVAAFERLVGQRPLRAVLLLDVLEHLLDPAATLRALGRLVAAHPGLQIVVSLPNVSHVDVGIKLLLGRWDLTDIGLLDDTHIRFFNRRLVALTMARTGWVEAAAHDVVNPFSDQLFPADIPALRPGTPLRQMLWRVRMGADPHAETYQFVRRYGYDTETAQRQLAALEADERPVIRGADDAFLSVAIQAPGSGSEAEQSRVGSLLADLSRQTDDDLEVLVCHDASTTADDVRRTLPAGDGPDGLAASVRFVATQPGVDWRDAAAHAARGRYVALLDGRTRLSSRYVATVRTLVEALPSRVVQVGARTGPLAVLDDVTSVDDVADRLEPVALDPLDLVTSVAFGDVALDAYAIPRQLWAASGAGFVSDAGESAVTLFLLTAIEACGIVRTAEPVTVIHRGGLRNVADDVDPLGKRLGLQPLVIPEGAGSQLLAHRRELAALLPDRNALANELAAVRDQVESLSTQLHERERRLAEAEATLESLSKLPTVRLRRKLGAIKRGLQAP